MLHNEFISLVLKYTSDRQHAEKLWSEIEAAYNNDERHFHNLDHLEQMLASLIPFQSAIEDWDTLVLALFYHDVVYDVVQYVTANDNELRSTEVAETALVFIHYPAEKIQRLKQHIMATKQHEIAADSDTNFFTDADLSILGQPWHVYENYLKAIREEYEIYPDGIYIPGRKKVLESFLQMERLFKTEHFYTLYEATARENISSELEILSVV